MRLDSNRALDYVFVDEHNRHKRLKGRILKSKVAGSYSDTV